MSSTMPGASSQDSQWWIFVIVGVVLAAVLAFTIGWIVVGRKLQQKKKYRRLNEDDVASF
jgi:membrane protein DedA with SNARE-associated domain